LNLFAERRMFVLGKMAEAGQPDFVAELVDELKGFDGRLEQVAKDFNDEELYEKIIEANQQRGVRLQELIDDGELPQEALDGMQKALDNQAMAMEKLQEALNNAGLAGEQTEDRSGVPDGVTVPDQAQPEVPTDNVPESPGEENRRP
ncbi:MAG: hypothetical protein SCM57_09015, partial [Bacillota bacterium]|nr:hypothetical protein [Bacillota bacterium]